MKFFNPASLLASPEAAIEKPPENDTSSFLIGSALKEAGSMTQKYFDLKALKKETEELAGYVNNTSPQLAQYLQTRAAGYNMGQTDPASERASLLKNVTSLHNMEIEQQKADNFANATKTSQLYGAKLSFAQKAAVDAQDAYEKFETEENKKAAAHKRARDANAAAGNGVMPDYVRQPNPYTSERDRTRANAQSAFQETPNTVQTGAVTRGGRSSINPIQSTEPALPGVDYEVPPGMTAAPLFPSGGSDADGATVAAMPSGSSDNPIAPLVLDSPPPVNPDALNLPETASVAPPTYNPATGLPPAAANDSATILDARFKAQAKAAAETAMTSIDRAKQSLSTQKDLVYGEGTYTQLTEMADAAKAQIAALPNPGSKAWSTSVNGILRQLNTAFENAPKLSVGQKAEGDNTTQNMTPSKWKQKSTGAPITMYVATSAGGAKTYRYVNGDGVLVVASEDDLKKMVPDESSTGTAPSVKPSVADSIKNVLQNAKINAK